MDKNQIKISFVGDIMCELPQLHAAKKLGNYNFLYMFQDIRKELQSADYLIGNLETPISRVGGYTNDLYCFNTPESFLKALKEASFDLLVTANNHCLDRGIRGLQQTMKNIKKNKMDYVGTYLKNEQKENIKIINVEGIKIAFLAYTYGTNYSYNHYPLNIKNLKLVNLIKDQKSDKSWPSYSMVNAQCLLYKRELKSFVKKILKYKRKRQPSNPIVIDELGKGEWIFSQDYIQKAREKIKKAKENSDIVLFMLHSGGQFNALPGSFTQKIVDEIKKEEINSIIGTHPHVVQKSEKYKDKLIAYSLGNFSISPSTEYLNHDLLPDYSILLNIYIDKSSKKIAQYGFSILKIIEDENHYLSIHFVNELIEKEKNEDKRRQLMNDNLFIYNRFLDKTEKEVQIKKEYIF